MQDSMPIVGQRSDLPPRQMQVLDFIEEFIDISGYPPTISEIAEALDMASTFGVRKHIEALEKKGFIRRAEPGLSRSIVVVRPSYERRGVRRAGSVPVVGRVTAGEPILAVENIEGWLAFKPLRDADRTFALKVKGESMKDAGILDGDYVICRQQETAENGDIIVALLDDSATVKTFRKRKGNTYELEPANERFKPIPILEDTVFQVLGKVTSVFRAIDENRPGLLQMRYS
jgi:repressor LexA